MKKKIRVPLSCRSDPFPDGSAAYISNFNALGFQVIADFICFCKVFGFFCLISFQNKSINFRISFAPDNIPAL